MNLTEARIGTEYRIQSVEGTGDIRRRMLDFGFTPGTAIELYKIAPLKSTYLFRVRGFLIALKASAAVTVMIVEKEKEKA